MKHTKHTNKNNRFRPKSFFFLGCLCILLGLMSIGTASAFSTFENNLTTAFAVLESENRTETSLPSAEADSKTDYATLHNLPVAGVTSVAPAMPTIGYNFSCAPRENPLGSGGNATTTENGQFVDLVEVSSAGGETWTVVSADGFYAVSSLQPPSSPTIITPDTPLSETFAGSGVYQLYGVHIEAEGYTLTVTNGTEVLTTQIAPGQCAYPNPAIINLPTGFCLPAAAVTLEADTDGEVGTGFFTILSADGGVLVNNATEFDPDALGFGSYIVRYEFSETGGATQTVAQNVDIAATGGSLACNNNLQISFQQDCEVLITPDMILEGGTEADGIYEITVFDGPLQVSNPVTEDFAEEELTVPVTSICDGNFCEGNITAEDKAAPVIDCPTAIVTAECTEGAAGVPAPTATDNCDGTITPALISSVVTEFDCDDPSGLLQRIERTYTAFDSNGNQPTDNCTQIIEIPRADLINVTFPADVVFDCGTDPDTSPAATGRPQLNGTEIFNNSVCNFYAFFTDETIETCGNSFKIVRNWTVLDWCNASSTPTNTLLAQQIIKVQDITPPDLTCPPAFSVSTANNNCQAAFLLPAATISDNCGTTTSQIFSPGGGQVSDGQVTGLGLGEFMLIYTATDECGNFAECPVTVTVTDTESPTMVCDEITAITLNPTGTAVVPAEEFDDGSYDGCTPIDFLVRRDDEPFAPTVQFDCDDPGAPVLVELQATDAFGNENICEVQVNVTDLSSPTLDCSPTNIEIECTEDFEDFFTQPMITESCGVFPIQQMTTQVINSCGAGVVTRTYSISDTNGNSSTCTQTITIVNNQELTLADIDFPDDFDSAVCGTSLESLAPDSLPVGMQRPIITAPPCSQIAVALDEEVFEADGACLMIRRTWTVINWCTYDPANPAAGGIFSDVQEITVTDNEPPVIVCPPNPFVKIINPNCDTTVFAFGPDTLTDCSPNLQLSSTLQRIPTDNVENVLMSSDGLGPYEDLLPGQYEVFLTADDGCGNQSTCDYILAVQDNKPPTPYCFDTLVISITDSGMVPFNAMCFDAGSFDNCTAQPDLLFSFSENPFDSVRIFTCEDLGLIPLLMYVTDEGFNSDACAVTLKLQDNGGFCENERSISGYVRTEAAEDVADVIISVNGEAEPLTDEEGFYTVSAAEGGDFTLVPAKDFNPLNGISTLDVLLIKEHILGLQTLNSPYKLIAADVNNSESVTTADIIALRRLILQTDEEFTNNTSWRFIDAVFEFPNPLHPWESGFPEFVNLNNVTADLENIDFTAVKIGDVNNTVNGLDYTGSEGEERGDNPLIIKAQNKFLRAGETEIFWLRQEEMTATAGLQISLEFDLDLLVLEEVITAAGVEITDFNLRQKQNGKIALSWENAALDKQSLRFGLVFKVKENTDWRSAIDLSDALLRTEAYRKTGGDFVREPVVLQFSENGNTEFRLLQNTPNPFITETALPFHLPAAAEVKLTIFDLTGRILSEHKGTYPAGRQEIKISRADLPAASGLLFYRIEAGNYSEVRRMILSKQP